MQIQIENFQEIHKWINKIQGNSQGMCNILPADSIAENIIFLPISWGSNINAY